MDFVPSEIGKVCDSNFGQEPSAEDESNLNSQHPNVSEIILTTTNQVPEPDSQLTNNKKKTKSSKSKLPKPRRSLS